MANIRARNGKLLFDFNVFNPCKYNVIHNGDLLM